MSESNLLYVGDLEIKDGHTLEVIGFQSRHSRPVRVELDAGITVTLDLTVEEARELAAQLNDAAQFSEDH